MRVSSVIKFGQEMMERYIHKHSIIIDATCGNGNDLFFLASHSPRSKIYAFDIQKQAIDNSKIKCQEYTNITYINSSHEDINQYVDSQIDLAVFNLGYLPNSDSNLTTSSTSTIRALEQIFLMLKKRGAVVITLYSGHDSHDEEKNVLNFIKTLNKYEYNIIKYDFILLEDSPYVVVIEKK